MGTSDNYNSVGTNLDQLPEDEKQKIILILKDEFEV